MRARGVARGVRGSGSRSRFLQGRALRLLLGFGSLLGGLRAYNVELKRPLVFRGPNGTFFGYSVLAHHHGSRSWLLAGAPRSSSNFLEAQRPGAVYKCAVRANPRRFCQEMHIGTRKARQCGRTCREERDDQWLGVSMARQSQDDGFLVCAHRWKNVYYQTDHKLPLGACFLISKHASTSTRTMSKPFVPCFKEHKKNYAEEHGSCQAGIASTFAQDSMVLGAPGSYYWTGSVIVHNLTSSKTMFYKEPDGGRTLVGYSSYLGYSVAAGSFLRPKSMEVVGGAPQHENTGKVYIFKVESSGLQVLHEIAGEMVGSYFGAALCAVDVNSDGLSDLLVGAPMTSRARDEGRVHVYINRGNSDLEEQEPPLSGSDAFSALFGAAISSLGDVDDDSFDDVAVGAPLEDEFGVVYIYHGNPHGLTSKYSQKIQGRNISPGIRMFGQSISGGLDMDGNGYPGKPPSSIPPHSRFLIYYCI
uniref:integrin alpha-9-like n=1 Tax=Myxine glutinosa TaxID=7769 RepID=UPI00358F1A1C